MRVAHVPLLLLLCGSTVRAEPKLGVEVITDFPLQIGGQIWAELPWRVRLSMSFGALPDPYLQTIHAVAVSAGAYDQATADLLTEALDRAFTWRLHIGWRPFPHRGAYFEGGFGLLALNSGLALADVIELASGVPAPRARNVGLGFKIDTVVETLGIEVGWMWQPWRGLTLRVSLGFAATVGAQVSIAPNFPALSDRSFVRFAENYVADLIQRYLFIPTVGLAVGWRLF